MSVVATTAFEERLDAFLQDRSEEARAVRVGEKETSEQAAIVARYADLFTREQLEALREAETTVAGVERESIARLRLTCQEGIVTRELAEREDALENALLAARVPWDGEELPLRSAQAQLAVEPDYGRRDGAGSGRARGFVRVQPRARGASRRPQRAGVRGHGDRRPGRAEPGREGRVAPPDPRRRRHRSRREHASVHAFARAVARPTARSRPGGDAEPRAHGLDPAALAARGDVHEGPQRRGVPRHAARDGLRPRGGGGHPDRPRGPPAEVTPRVRDRRRPAAGRPSDHEGAGWAARLRGVPARGRSRASLRRLRPDAAALVPPALARSRPDRDLLVPSRLDLQRAELARRALRALGRRGAGERRRRAVLEHSALPPLLGKARLRARLLGPFPVAGWHARGVRGAAHGRDRDSLPGRKPPRRHGRRLLLGRLPAGLDPVRAAPRLSPARGRGGLVAAGAGPASCCERSSGRGRGRRPRRSRSGSASTRSTPRRSSQSCPA